MEQVARQMVPATLVLGSLAYLMMTISQIGNGGSPTVDLNISSGRMMGIKRTSRTGRGYFDFRGIPYAEQPVGALRFEPPLPAKPWDVPVWDATTHGAFCLQYDFLLRVLQGDESCLFLNVASPNSLSKPEKLFPVIVFFYGGGFMSGYTNVYNGFYFMDEDIVLVTVNYRLGLFGFLNTGDDVVRGNMGLKDQNMALQWIQKNIASFGGDPNKVTIMGQSAGGSSTHFQMLAPMSKGLFHRAISQSGTASAIFAFNPKPRKQALRLGRMMDCPTNSSQEMVACLKALPALVLNRADREYLDFLEGRQGFYVPSVEAVNDSNTFLSDTPKNLMREGKVIDVPWIVGANTNEAILFTLVIIQDGSLTKIVKNWYKYCPVIFDYEGHPNSRNISLAIKDRILKGQEFGPDAIMETAHALTDRYFNEGIYDSIRLQSNASTIYAYQFTYQGEFSFARLVSGMTSFLPKLLGFAYSLGRRWFAKTLRLDTPRMDGCHLDELPLFFHLPIVSGQIVPGSKDYPMSSALVKAWSMFARDGKPGNLFGVEWEPIPKNASLDEASIKYMKIDVDPKMTPEPFTTAIEFWKSLKLLR